VTLHSFYTLLSGTTAHTTAFYIGASVSTHRTSFGTFPRARFVATNLTNKRRSLLDLTLRLQKTSLTVGTVKKPTERPRIGRARNRMASVLINFGDRPDSLRHRRRRD